MKRTKRQNVERYDLINVAVFYIPRANRNFCWKNSHFNENTTQKTPCHNLHWNTDRIVQTSWQFRSQCRPYRIRRHIWFFHNVSTSFIWARIVRFEYVFMNYNVGLCIWITEGYMLLKFNLLPILAPWKIFILYALLKYEYCFE